MKCPNCKTNWSGFYNSTTTATTELGICQKCGEYISVDLVQLLKEAENKKGKMIHCTLRS